MQNKMDGVADDIANVNTTGYKRKEMSFQELLLNAIIENDVLISDNVNNAAISTGAKCTVGSINFKQGTLIPSSGEYHMAIEGNGFFGVRDEQGNLMLTRNGGFHRNENGTISDDKGLPLDINLEIPYNQWPSSGLSISKQGIITATVDNENVELGRVVLYTPENEETLTSLGEGLYMINENVPLYNSVDQPDLLGKINQNMLEASNVDAVKSLVEMITAQRAYSMNSKVVQSTDDILSMINNIKQ